jgi:Protein of unknown function (DUF1566)
MRITHRTTGIVMGVAISVLLASIISVLSGTLDSPGAPSATSSYTLEDIYKRLNDGTAGNTIMFTEPVGGATAGTMHTLIDIMGKAPAANDTTGAVVGDVLAGKTFWGRTFGGWGLKAGNVTAGANVIGGQGLKDIPIPPGLYSGSTNATANDTNLAANNIKTGTTIFGVQGTFTAGANAVSADILQYKTAYVSGNLVTGNLTAGANVIGDPVSRVITIPAGLYSGSTTATANDDNLAVNNIKQAVNIFGVVGTGRISVGTALSTDVLVGTTFSNDSNTGIDGGIVNVGAQFITPGTSAVSINLGYHNGSGNVAGAANLAANNIKFNTTIFGVTGSLAGGVPCTGALSTGKRWCSNNGTVTDTTTGLIWLQDASWGNNKPWRANSGYDDARSAAGLLASGTGGLSDGSAEGDWRLPTISELVTLKTGTEPISSTTMFKFTGVRADYYLSSTTDVTNIGFIKMLSLAGNSVDVTNGDKWYSRDGWSFWPVRSGR